MAATAAQAFQRARRSPAPSARASSHSAHVIGTTTAKTPFTSRTAQNPAIMPAVQAGARAGAFSRVHGEEERGQQRELVVGADAVDEGDEDELQDPAERACVARGRDRCGDEGDEDERRGLVERVHRIRGLHRRKPESCERRGQDEDARRVLAVGAFGIPEAPPLGCDPLAERQFADSRRDARVEAGVGVRALVAGRRDERGGDHHRQRPRQAGRAKVDRPGVGARRYRSGSVMASYSRYASANPICATNIIRYMCAHDTWFSSTARSSGRRSIR